MAKPKPKLYEVTLGPMKTTQKVKLEAYGMQVNHRGDLLLIDHATDYMNPRLVCTYRSGAWISCKLVKEQDDATPTN